MSMKFDRNGWGGYYFGKYNIYSTYNQTDSEGNLFEGYCWCIKEDLDSDVCDFVAETLEECIEWVLGCCY